MGITPGYTAIGILAPLALVILRLIQGIAVSGPGTKDRLFCRHLNITKQENL